ncbi:MAG: acetyltransferase [Arenibacter sp.]
MLIVGAKGFAKEVLEIFHEDDNLENLAFYDDVSKGLSIKLFNTFPVFTNIKQAESFFNTIDKRFTLGLGNPTLRKKLHNKFLSIGGVFTSTISKDARVGNYEVQIGEGVNILSGAIISNGVSVGKGCIIYFNAVITHDCIIKDFVEISPAAQILGRVYIGDYSQIGSNATILPDVKIGSNVIIGAGAVVTKDVPDNCVVAGVPGVIIKRLPKLIIAD